MVLIVGTVLAFIYMALKPKQDINRANDKRKQILSAVHITAPSNDAIENTYNKYIVAGYLIDSEGNVVDSAQNVAFNVDMKNNVKEAQRQLPVFICRLDDGSVKHVIPAYGAGLWGPIWGYIAIDDNGTDVYGAYFSHESETPGLGAEIGNEKFQQQFKGKKIYVNGEFKSLGVMKAGQKPTDGADYVNAISGGTITSRGVQAMLEDCLTPYDPYFKKLSQR